MDVFHRPLSEIGKLNSREVNWYIAELTLRAREDKARERAAKARGE